MRARDGTAQRTVISATRHSGGVLIFDGIWFPRGWSPAAFGDRNCCDVWIAQYPVWARKPPITPAEGQA